MSMWNKNAVIAIAALLSAGALFPNVGQARPPQVSTEMQDFQSPQAEIMSSARHGLLIAAADRGDWTAWGGALRGSPALRHSDRGHHDQVENPRRQRSDFEQS